MNVFTLVRNQVVEAIEAEVAAGGLPADLKLDAITAEPPRDASHGDISTNAAMVLAKPAQMKPRDVAEKIVARLADADGIVSADIAGPGFINLRLEPSVWQGVVSDVLKAGVAYGDSDLGQDVPVNVEYVSANPTGPLHVGHARGAVFGDALAALLAKAGYAVTKEFYVNDAGAQVDSLARALHFRYLEALGKKSAADFTAAAAAGEVEYAGDYLKDAASALSKRDGEKWVDAPIEDWLVPLRQFAIDSMMDMIRDDLASLGISQDRFTSERALVDAGQVDRAIADLEKQGLVYTGVLEPPKGKKPDDWEPRPQMLFKATEFGDDIDRPFQKSDGSWTYFASDVAYHRDKFDRGFAEMIDVWGADHGGYVKRMQAGVKALSANKGSLDVKICQLVKLFDNGKPVAMSKRAGTFVTLRDLIDAVGKDVVRFIMLTRKNDAPLDFDFAKVTEKSRDNPVFYVQYAHARIYSVFRHAADVLPGQDLSEASLAKADLSLCSDAYELAVMRTVASWPRIIDAAALAHEPHRIAFYLYDLAAQLHALWNRGNEDAEMRFLLPDQPDRSMARLALVRSVAVVIASGLDVFGVEPVKEMR
ncbi:MAG: arginine--tRNA ligase [Rhodospirillaceae bacterium]|jgi:arginyl-tRNA synthetase|nr:arginine--tRNA ligase [Rhodospirillaceae bacterium]MBT5566807.1 arginine--tRNA ligase [Rhodospirillaceae bacterium]MBT6089480.1 arginine--tRNA ligase [Rhodospirillaceae bacterium]MBT6961982.1 arginine--tRNA ligase [Rhodospirillaceae bacterium]